MKDHHATKKEKDATKKEKDAAKKEKDAVKKDAARKEHEQQHPAIKLSLEAQILQESRRSQFRGHSKTGIKLDLQDRHAIAESENEDWELYIQDEGDEDYDGQLQDYNKGRLSTQEIRKELHLTVKPSTLDKLVVSAFEKDYSDKTCPSRSRKPLERLTPKSTMDKGSMKEFESWSIIESSSGMHGRESSQNTTTGPYSRERNIFGPSDWQKRRERFVCVGHADPSAVNDAMPYGGMKYKPIPRPATPRGWTARKNCVMFLFTLGFCCCCITPCAFSIWQKQRRK